jgi:hypothetical protein
MAIKRSNMQLLLPSFYWSAGTRKFPLSVLLLVRREVCSDGTFFYWSDREYIPIVCPSIGQMEEVYSHYPSSYWSDRGEDIPVIRPSV